MLHFIVQSKATQATREFERNLFPSEEKPQLLQFVESAKTLSNCAFVKNWPQINPSIHLGNDGSVTNVGELPTEEEIAAFLHFLRPFYLNNEQTNFNRIANLTSKHLDDLEMVECIREWKRVYDGRASQNVFELKVSGEIINSEKFFDNYVNAFHYHRDQERRENIDAIAEHFPLEALKPIFVILLYMRLKAITKLASLLLNCFNREDGRPITIYVR